MLHEIKDAPYTVFGVTELPSLYSITMCVGGLKAILDNLDPDDTLKVVVHVDGRVEYYASTSAEHRRK